MRNGETLGSADILARLVSFDTTSRNSNLALIEWIRSYLDGWNVHYRESRDATGQKANLHAIVGPDRSGGLAFSGHVDTVPVDGQNWSSDPFRLRADGDRLHARGATDMKGFVASMLAAVPDLLASGADSSPVHLLITFDEEVDCGGARLLVRDMAEHGRTPDRVVVGEPSGLRPIVAHKGRVSARGTVRGRAAHSADPRTGANALHAAARAIVFVADEATRLERDGVRVDGFEPPWSTTQCGLASGGTILNIVPDAARFDIEWRIVPGEDGLALLERLRRHVEEHVRPELAARHGETSITIELIHELPPLAPDAAGARLAALAGRAADQTDRAPGFVSYGTEAGIFQGAGMEAIVCGPGDIARAHRPDEWIGRDELAGCDAFLRRMAALAAA